MQDLNVVVVKGNLTRDPELRHTPSGVAVCKLRVAVNDRKKGNSGDWEDKPNYFDVTVWENAAEACAQYLSKGSPVLIKGKLDWREWDAQDGSKRQAVEIVADKFSGVTFLHSGNGDGGGRSGGGGGQSSGGGQYTPRESAQGGSSYGLPPDGADDDIPFRANPYDIRRRLYCGSDGETAYV